MRTLQLDGSGNRNQDRSIQPSAIVGELPPFALAPPTPTPTTPTSRGVATPRPTVPPGNAVATDPAGGPLPTPPPTWTAAGPSPVDADRTTPSVALGLLGILAAAALVGTWLFRSPRRDRPGSHR
jgi:hypothetical protein